MSKINDFQDDFYMFSQNRGMTYDDRLELWKEFNLSASKDVETTSNHLKEIIHKPTFLYRYRSLRDISLDALLNNRLYFSSATCFDDPFDTFVSINAEKLSREIEINSKFMPILSNPQIAHGNSNMNFDCRDKNFISNVIDFTQNFIKQRVFVACLSEDHLNDHLWMQNAQNHEGFVVVYNLENNGLVFADSANPDPSFLRRQPIPLYPVVYLEKGYDTTDFAISVLKSLNKQGDVIKNDFLNNNNIWELTKISIAKKFCHHNDNEWRLIFSSPVVSIKNPYLICQPYGIILGINMPKAYRIILTNIARCIGIKNIYEVKTNDDAQFKIEPYI